MDSHIDRRSAADRRAVAPQVIAEPLGVVPGFNRRGAPARPRLGPNRLLRGQRSNGHFGRVPARCCYTGASIMALGD